MGPINTIDWLAYQDVPLPSPIDDVVQRYVDVFSSSDAEKRDVFREQTSSGVYHVLGEFAMRMASRAVRERSVSHLRSALNAWAAAGGTSGSDWRDDGLAMVPLIDAAKRIGADAMSECARAAELAEPCTARLLRSAPQQRWFERAVFFVFPRLAPVRWTNEASEGGFRYVVHGRDEARARLAEILEELEKRKHE